MISDSFADRARAIKEAGTVPGLLFRVTSPRLRKHLADRSAYHTKRANDKNQEIPELEKALAALSDSIDKIKGFGKEQMAAAANFSNKTTAAYGFDGSQQVNQLEAQIDQLRRDIKDHQNKAASFAFLAESVWDPDYALCWADLQQIELVK